MKNNMFEYIERKSNEINIFKDKCNLVKEVKIESLTNVIKSKEELVYDLRLENFKKYYHELTNKNNFSVVDDFTYNYTYERFNGFVEVKNFVNKFYKINDKFTTSNYFTTSGMGAIVSLLTSLTRNFGYQVDLLHEETYFETIKFLNISNCVSENKMLYVDTIASDYDFLFENYIDDYSGIIIDTTCFHPFMFSNIIEKILSMNKICILVRSHTKLDMMGFEFSHMGSISFIYNADSDHLYGDFISDCKHQIGVIGACLPPDRFTTFFYDKDILELNLNRTRIISKNSEYLSELLSKDNYSVLLPNHKQFIVLNFNSDKIVLSDLKEKIVLFCKKNSTKFPIYHAVSFGFDYIALDCYDNYRDGKFKLRISMTDYPIEIIDMFYEEIKSFLKEII